MNIITEEMWLEVDEIIRRNKDKKGSLIPVLEECQNVCGYLPVEVQERVSKGLNVPGSTVFGVVTFYSFFTMVPRGRHTIKVCMGTACYVKGGATNLDHIQDEFKLKVGGTSQDFRFSLDSVRCLGACGMAPAVVVNGDAYAQVSKDNIKKILKQYK